MLRLPKIVTLTNMGEADLARQQRICAVSLTREKTFKGRGGSRVSKSHGGANAPQAACGAASGGCAASTFLPR
jgi:hypothetical protein